MTELTELDDLTELSEPYVPRRPHQGLSTSQLKFTLETTRIQNQIRSVRYDQIVNQWGALWTIHQKRCTKRKARCYEICKLPEAEAFVPEIERIFAQVVANKEQIDELEEELYIRGKEEKAAKKAQEEAERLAREAAEESENGS